MIKLVSIPSDTKEAARLRSEVLRTTKERRVCEHYACILNLKKFFDFSKLSFFIKLACAVLPALVLGKLFDDAIEAVLGNPIPIAIVLIVGGIVLLFIDSKFQNPTILKEEDITIKKAVTIGFWQCLALIPGMSRSAATIIGGMQQKLTRNVAAEFSFFLAVPTMAAATGYKLLKAYKTTPEILLNKENLILLGVGNLVAFIVALLAIKFFIGFLQKHGFKLFGWYRIIAGITLLALIYTGLLK